MLVTQFLELVRERLDVPADRWLVQVDTVLDHAATGFTTPRYVWVPTRDTYGPPERAGGNPRQIYTRFAGLELHLWVDDVEDGEERLLDVLSALHDEGAVSVEPIATNWTGDSPIGRGVLITHGMRLRIPVTRRAAAVGRAEAVAPDTSVSAPGDGKLDWGEGEDEDS